jgi:prepilin-type N-terminal cleavage/methylation domain-containing protein
MAEPLLLNVDTQEFMVQPRSEAGFTLIDMLITVAIIGVLAGMAVPSLSNVTERMKLGQGQREVERELQTARLKAVTANRRIRVRFNCPAVRQYRMVEVIGTAADDAAAATRCSEILYKATADNNPLTRPNHDGPIRNLPKDVSFGAAAALEFGPDGTVKYFSGGAYVNVPDPDGTAVTLTKGTDVAKITVNRLGKIQLVQTQ